MSDAEVHGNPSSILSCNIRNHTFISYSVWTKVVAWPTRLRLRGTDQTWSDLMLFVIVFDMSQVPGWVSGPRNWVALWRPLAGSTLGPSKFQRKAQKQIVDGDGGDDVWRKPWTISLIGSEKWVMCSLPVLWIIQLPFKNGLFQKPKLWHFLTKKLLYYQSCNFIPGKVSLNSVTVTVFIGCHSTSWPTCVFNPDWMNLSVMTCSRYILSCSLSLSRRRCGSDV